MKININIPLSGEALTLALSINAWHLDHGRTEIVFSEAGPYPHITLLMGDIESDLVPEVIQRTQNLTVHLSRCSIAFTAAHRPAPDSRYVFLGIKRPNIVRRFKELVAKSLDGIVRPSAYGGVEVAPHVTVAYLGLAAEYRPFGGDTQMKKNWSPSVLAVSMTGSHGTCTRILATLQLEEAKQDKSSVRGKPRR